MQQLPHFQEITLDANGQIGTFPFSIWTYRLDRTKLHHHDFAELSFVIEGDGTETVNGHSHPLQPGTVTFIPPHQLHAFESIAAKPTLKYCVIFDLGLLSGTPLLSSQYSRLLQFGNRLPSAATLSPEQSEKMKAVMECMLWEYKHEEVGKTSFLVTKLSEALLLLLRSHVHAYGAGDADRKWHDADEDRAKQPKPGVAQPKGTMQGDLVDAVSYIHRHYHERLKLDMLAERYKISVPHFSRRFKELTGSNFLDYLHTLRTRSAVSLLLSTDIPVTDIPAETGFESFRTFTRVFKGQTGLTPSEYRNKHRLARAAME